MNPEIRPFSDCLDAHGGTLDFFSYIWSETAMKDNAVGFESMLS